MVVRLGITLSRSRRGKGDRMSGGLEWPAPGMRPCGARAEDVKTGARLSCLLRPGHDSNHYWERIEGAQLLSAFWIGDAKTVTYIGRVDA